MSHDLFCVYVLFPQLRLRGKKRGWGALQRAAQSGKEKAPGSVGKKNGDWGCRSPRESCQPAGVPDLQPVRRIGRDCLVVVRPNARIFAAERKMAVDIPAAQGDRNAKYSLQQKQMNPDLRQLFLVVISGLGIGLARFLANCP